MRLHLPTALRAALIACLAIASTSYADTYLTEGVDITGSQFSYDAYAFVATLADSTNRFYDGGKGNHGWTNSTVTSNAASLYYADGKNSFDFLGEELSSRITTTSFNTYSSFSNLTDDSGHCWAYTSANMLQYWQTYYGVFATQARTQNTKAPVHGLTYDKQHFSALAGTQSLKLNMLFYDNWEGSYGGTTSTAFTWYLAGKNDSDYLTGSDSGGYFAQYFPTAESTNSVTSVWNNSAAGTISQESFNTSIKQHFGYEQQADGTWEQTTKGQILYLELVKNPGYSGSHAITCYGFDTDASGNITALYIVNSDGSDYQLIKLFGKLTENGYQLYTNESCSLSWNEWRLTGWSSINTPQELKDMLAEYESGKQTWMGNLEAWTNAAAVAADVDVLPTDETGWMTYAGTGTDHAGYYNTYYTTGRDVQFNDEAENTTVAVAEDITAGDMTVDNSSKAYVFDGGESRKTITVGDFTKSGSGALSFSNIKLVADNATLGSDVTFDELHVKGTLNADGKVIVANSIRLDGNATVGNIGGSGTFDPADGTTALTITGGTTTVNNSDRWMNIKTLEMSEEARLVMGSSVHVSENITTTTTTTGTLAEGTEAGIQAKYCIYVGSKDSEGKRVEGTGDVTLKGSLKTTNNAYINILGTADVSGDITSGGTLDIGGNATVGGNLTASGKATIGGQLTAGTATFKNGGSIGSIGIVNGSAGDSTIGTTAMVVSGGELKVTSSNWTNLKSLDIAEKAKLNITAASVYVAENITSNTAATGSLTTTGGLLADWCIKVGTLNSEGKRVEGTGDVTLKGDMATTQNGYINILGTANVSGNVSAGGTLDIGGNATVGGNLTSNGKATIGGQLTAGTATFKNGGSIGSIGIVNGSAGDSTIGTTAMVVSGGELKVTSSGWTNLKSLELSGASKLDITKASVYVAENISSSVTGEQTTNLNAQWCIKVGTLGEDNKLKANTGDVTLKGDMTAGAYINIMGNANVSGTMSSSGTGKDHDISIGGNATIGGSLSAKKNVTIGGLATLNGGGSVDGTMTVGSMEVAAGKTLTAKGGLTVNGALKGGTVTEPEGAKAAISSEGSISLGGNVSNISLQANGITLAAAGGSEFTLDSVDVVLTGGELKLTNVRVQGDCSFSAGEALATQAVVNASNVTFVLDSSNSCIRDVEPQTYTLLTTAEEGGKTLYIDSGMMEGLDVKGSMTLDLSAWEDTIVNDGYDSVVMSFAETTNFSEAETVTLKLGKQTMTAESLSNNAFFFSFEQPGQAVPEPTTTTLSLLALAWLLSRRKRSEK